VPSLAYWVALGSFEWTALSDGKVLDDDDVTQREGFGGGVVSDPVMS
jgi:hypothetical protein